MFNKFGGSDKKTVVMEDGCTYLLKFTDSSREQKLEISYCINNMILEYMGCKVYQLIVTRRDRPSVLENTEGLSLCVFLPGSVGMAGEEAFVFVFDEDDISSETQGKLLRAMT